MTKFLGSGAIIFVGVILTLLPSEFWFLIWWLVGPTGFWQKALIAGAGLWICGAVQIGFAIAGGIFTMVFLSEYRDRSTWRR